MQPKFDPVIARIWAHQFLNRAQNYLVDRSFAWTEPFIDRLGLECKTVLLI